MTKKIFNKIFPKKGGNKRGVSPVIATILLIALTVTAAAIVYFVVVPLFEGKGELVLMSSWTLSDSDSDGNFDTLTGDLFNMGTKEITLDEAATVVVQVSAIPTLSKAYEPNQPIKVNAESYTWEITSDLVYTIQEEQEVKIEANNASDQIPSLTQYEITIHYDNNQMTTGSQFSNFVTGDGGEDPEDPVIEYLSSALVLRTAAEDSKTSRGSFPATSGYSPRLWFLAGIFKSGTRNLHLDTTDYIALNSFGATEDYHPYFGITDEYSEGPITSHTGYKNLPYNDSGTYPGCVSFCGTSFDANDDIDWPQRGIVYMFSYIYNPTNDSMDVDISIQADDAYSLWANGEFLSTGTQTASGWKTWRTPTQITMNPGYNVITIKAADAGGNWNAQVLFWDTGAVDNITSLLNVWPIINPTSTYW